MPSYRRNHIVTRGYLDLFSRDGLVACHFVDTGERKDLAPSSVGVRNDFYVVRLPDGRRDTSWEQAMAPAEGAAVEVLREMEQRWPLTGEDAATVAEFIALHILRGPAWRDEFRRLTQANLQDPSLRRRYPVSDAQWAAATAFAESDDYRRDAFMRLLARAVVVVGSMHWSLLRFSSPVVMTSDQPVAAVPLVTDRVVEPRAVPPNGLANVVEIRFPVDPHHALLLTWLDAGDGPPVQTVPRALAANLNFSVRAQCDRQFFHRPKTSPPHRVGVYPPIGSMLFRGYAAGAVRRSRRRALVLKRIDALLDADDLLEKVPVLRARSQDAGRAA